MNFALSKDISSFLAATGCERLSKSAERWRSALYQLRHLNLPHTSSALPVSCCWRYGLTLEIEIIEYTVAGLYTDELLPI
jgi:hypothetical protein